MHVAASRYDGGGRQRKGNAWDLSTADGGDGALRSFRVPPVLVVAGSLMRSCASRFAAGCTILEPCTLGDRDGLVSPDGSYQSDAPEPDTLGALQSAKAKT